ncbi:MAG: phosphopantetheine-binding protein [Flavobacteriales bacterium]
MESFLKETISEIAFSDVENDELLWESGILDSITIIELSVEIENEFDIKIPIQDVVIDNFGSVNKLVKYIESKRN